MLEEFDQLASRIGDLARLVQALRAENQQLRTQLTNASTDLEGMRRRVDEAGRRLDALMERLPAAPASGASGVTWNT